MIMRFKHLGNSLVLRRRRSSLVLFECHFCYANIVVSSRRAPQRSIYPPCIIETLTDDLDATSYIQRTTILLLPCQLSLMLTSLSLTILSLTSCTTRIITCPSIILTQTIPSFLGTLAFLLGIGIFLDQFKVRWNL